MSKLPDIRTQIDMIDEQLMNLLSSRAQLVHKVGEVKKNEGLPIFAPERESAVYHRLMELNKGRLPEKSVQAVFREIMSTALCLEDDLSIAYFGSAGSWTNQAAINKFGHSVRYLPQSSFDGVFDAVLRGRAHYGVLPVENSTEGAVTPALDLLMNSHLKVCSQIFIRIEHSLLSRESLANITTIYSHPQAFSQCRGWLQKNYPNAQLVEASSTSSAVELVAGARVGDGLAAIASPLCGEIYSLPVAISAVQDLQANTTRFFVIGEKMCPPTGDDKTSLLFVVKNIPGSLVRALRCLEENNINLTSIQSRPCKQKEWEYVFFVDLDNHSESDDMQVALAALGEVCESVKVLGSYPAARLNL